MTGDRRRVIHLYYAFQIFFSLLLWLPVFYEYQKRIGLTDAEIFSIQSLYYIVFCLLEIPTGLLADAWGRLRCMRAGAAVLVLSNLLPVVAQSYAGMLAHFVLIALSRSLISGASSAYLYDTLKGAGPGEYKKAEGNARAFGLLGKVVLWAGVGALMEWKLTLPYMATVVTSALAVVFAACLPRAEAEAPLEKAAKKRVGKHVRETLALLRGSPTLLLVMLQGVSAFVLARIVQVNLFQPLLQQKGFTLASFGAVMSAMTLAEAAGAYFPSLFRRGPLDRAHGWRGDLNGVSVLTGLLGLSLWALAAIPAGALLATVLSLGLFSFAIGLSFPIQRQLMNDVIPDSKYRATLLSLESILDRAVNAAVAAVLGGFVGQGRIGDFLEMAAAVSIAVIVLLHALLRLTKIFLVHATR